MKKNKGYTLLELMIVIAMLAIFLMLALISFGPAKEFTQKSAVNTDSKILVNAINSWIADNSNASQRPANFFSKNSQDREVYRYISGNDVYKDTNLMLNDKGELLIGDKENGHIYVTFEKGVLNTRYIDESGVETADVKYFVSPTKNENSDKVDGYDDKVAKFQIIEKDYNEIKEDI